MMTRLCAYLVAASTAMAASTGMATVWSPPEAPVTAHAALVSSAGSALGPGNRRTTVSGNGFEPHAEVGIVLYAEPRLLTTLTADDTRGFSGEVTLPEGVAGEGRLVAAGIDARHEQIRYLGLPITMNGGEMPVTGAPIWMLAAYAAVLIALGLFAVVQTRRRSEGKPQK